MPRSIKVIGAFAFSALLVYLGFKYFLTEEQKGMIFSVPVSVHLLSALLVIFVFISNGFILRLLYKRVSNLKLSNYDTFTLPIVMNLWGYIIPFQGSFLYTITYIYSKYKKSISDSMRVYIITLSVSMSLAGLIGLIYAMVSTVYIPKVFLVICIPLLFNPYILILLSKFTGKYKHSQKTWFKKLMERVDSLIQIKGIDQQLIFYMLLLNVVNVSFYTLWSYWIAISLNLNLDIFQLVIITLLMRLTVLIKITPGNLGISQFASGGIAVLVGGAINDGFLLSTFQYLTMIIVAVTVGGICSFLNMKHMNWQSLKSLVSRKGTN